MNPLQFENVRLSKSFVLLDFMYDRDVYTFGQPLSVKGILTPTHLEMGRKLCETVLEPIIDAYGPVSVAGGFWPYAVRTANGHHAVSPHHWDEDHGAAADIAVHNWVNSDRAPIQLADTIDKTGLPFDRLIAYAGSEFLCISTSHKEPRFALYENIRIKGSSPRYQNWGSSRGDRARRQASNLPVRTDWRREAGEKVHSTNKSIRPHHIRVGRYFVLLDFCRNSRALCLGRNTVPPTTLTDVITVARCFAEVLDTVVAVHGRVTILRGIEPKDFSTDEFASFHRWQPGANAENIHRVLFLLTAGADTEAVLDLLENHPSVVTLEASHHPTGSMQIELEIVAFTPHHEWKSTT